MLGTLTVVTTNRTASKGDDVRPVVIRMPSELHQAVKAKAATEERSMAQAIRYALRLYTQSP
jgi:predicted HicB family RNase H-like nuclease